MKRRRKAKIVPVELGMVNPAMDDLIKRTKSKYVLVMLAAKRARALQEGGSCLTERAHVEKYVTNAFGEIEERKIRARVRDEEEER